MPRTRKNIRVVASEIRELREVLQRTKQCPGMYFLTKTVAEAIGSLGERLRRSPLHDWLREWLAHSFHLDCECAWEAMALHLVSGTKTVRKKTQWSPELEFEVVEIASGRDALRRFGASPAKQVKAIQGLCDLILTFLTWLEGQKPAERRRFRQRFLCK